MSSDRPLLDLSSMLSLGLFLMFLGTGVAKWSGAEFVVATFGGSPLPLWALAGLGLVEIAAAVLVIIESTRRVGAALLVVLMAGAMSYHLARGELALLPIPASVLVASLALRALEVRRLVTLPAARRR